MASADLTLDSIGELIAREMERKIDDVPLGEFSASDLAKKLKTAPRTARKIAGDLLKSGAIAPTRKYRVRTGKLILPIQHYRRTR